MRTSKLKKIQLNTNLLIQASQLGNFAIVKELLPYSDPDAKKSAALRMAASNGHADIVQLLIPFSDPNETYDDDSNALTWAARNGHTQCVELLIPVSDPTIDHSHALKLAVQYEHIDCVKLLIPVSNPKDRNSAALKEASKIGNISLINLLIPVSNCDEVLNWLAGKHRNTSILQQCVDEYEALQQKERLCGSLSGIENTQYNSAKRKI